MHPIELAKSPVALMNWALIFEAAESEARSAHQQQQQRHAR
jgi:hypothetical protein